MYLLDHLFPDCCPICLKPVIPKGCFLHEACKGKLKFIGSPYCLKCGREIGREEEEYCSSCRKRNFVFEAGRCTFDYRSDIGKAVRVFKEEGTREFAEFFGKAAAERHKCFIENANVQVIVPVPLATGKLKERGFNQAELFANSLSAHLGIPVAGLLRKTGKTKDQKGLNGRERENNLTGVFTAETYWQKMPERILLVDDVFTTGSTVNACSAALKEAGAKHIFFICMTAGTADI